jgi:hypothetical protein
MKRFKNHLIAVAVLSVLAIIGTIMNSHQAKAQGPPGGLAVNIVNPLPVPVTGSTTVSGTIAATQSGAWNVGITGTPNVNVTNPATAPVLSLNVNDPGRIAYQSDLSLSCNSTTQCAGSFPIVAANHRLVIQHLNGEVAFSGSPSSLFVALRGNGTAQSTSIVTASLPAQNGFPAVSAFDQSILLYFDAGQLPSAVVDGNNFLFAEITLTGYMLDCTIAPCAAIAH